MASPRGERPSSPHSQHEEGRAWALGELGQWLCPMALGTTQEGPPGPGLHRAGVLALGRGQPREGPQVRLCPGGHLGGTVWAGQRRGVGGGQSPGDGWMPTDKTPAPLPRELPARAELT